MVMTHGVTRCVLYAMLRSVRRRSAPDYSRLDANKETQPRERETRRCTQLSATQAKIDRDGGQAINEAFTVPRITLCLLCCLNWF